MLVFLELKVSDIWFPEVEYTDSDFTQIEMTSPYVAIQKRSQAEEDDLSRVKRGKEKHRFYSRFLFFLSFQMNIFLVL